MWVVVEKLWWMESEFTNRSWSRTQDKIIHRKDRCLVWRRQCADQNMILSLCFCHRQLVQYTEMDRRRRRSGKVPGEPMCVNGERNLGGDRKNICEKFRWEGWYVGQSWGGREVVCGRVEGGKVLRAMDSALQGVQQRCVDKRPVGRVLGGCESSWMENMYENRKNISKIWGNKTQKK